MPAFLRIESHENPLGIDVRNPMLSWMIEEEDQKGGRGIRQNAYQILVAGSEELLAAGNGDLWDSGWVNSDQSLHIVYGGKPLQARKQAHWKVRIKDQDGSPSKWSRPAVWTMGALGDWKSPWIASRDVPMKPPIGQTYIPVADQKGIFAEHTLGYHAVIAASADTVKWVQVDLGQVVPLQRIRLKTLNHDDVKGFGFPLRYRLEASDDADFSQPRLLDDHTAADVPNPGATWLTVDGQGKPGRYVRLTATKLFSRPGNPAEFCFGLRALEVISGERNVAFKAPVQALDSVEAFGWGKNQLTDPLERRREALLLRRDVTLDAKPLRALARVSAMGFRRFQHQRQ